MNWIGWVSFGGFQKEGSVDDIPVYISRSLLFPVPYLVHCFHGSSLEIEP